MTRTTVAGAVCITTSSAIGVTISSVMTTGASMRSPEMIVGAGGVGVEGVGVEGVGVEGVGAEGVGAGVTVST